ncbi:MAG: amidase [Candidatus Kariarchaeaceae archaeon]
MINNNSKNRMRATDVLTDLSAAKLAQIIKNKEISVEEVIEAHIKRIEEVDNHLNAVVIPLFDEARAQAKEADMAIRENQKIGPLHGVPITIKALFEVTGTEVNLGVPNQQGRLSTDEGPLVSRLREAGAIILGKTNIMMTLSGWETDNPIYGPTLNPWNLKRSPGGSSGGESAIIAARGSPWGLASDFGGSIRIPAHFCGLHGFKPTSGRLTNTDVPAHLFSSGQNVIIPQPGPIARTVADLKLMMKILTDLPYARTADLVPPIPWADPDEVLVENLTIGVYDESEAFPVSPSIKRAINEAAHVLQEKGATIKQISSPIRTKESMLLFLEINASCGDESIPRTLAGSKPNHLLKGLLNAIKIPDRLRPIITWVMAKRGQKHLANLIRVMRTRSSEEYVKVIERVNNYREGFLQMIEKDGIDVILCPPSALVAPHHGATEHLLPIPFSYAIQYNLLGMPAGVVSITCVKEDEQTSEIHSQSRDLVHKTAMEVENGSTGLPVGVQVVSHHWRDDIVLKVMETLEEIFVKKTDYPMNLSTIKMVKK